MQLSVLSAVKVNMAKFMSASVSIAFVTCFLTKGERYQIWAPSVMSIYLLYDSGIHDGISYQSIAWTTELQTVTVKHLYLVLWMN